MRSNTTIMKETLQILTETKKILFIDTETTGLKKDSEIIQFSGILYQLISNGSLEEISRINYYINPKQKIPPKVQQITGLSNQFLSRVEKEEIVFQQIENYMDDCYKQGAIIAGYCVDFDIRMIKSMYARQNASYPDFVSLDVKKIAKDIFIEDDLKDYKLQTCISHIGLDAGIRFHSAVDDVYATGLLFEHCIKSYLQQVSEDKKINLEVKFISATYFVNPQQKSMRRIIVYTSLGEVYYDTIKHGWGVKQNSEMANSTFEHLNLDKLEKDLLQKYHYGSMDSMIKALESLYKQK